MGLLFAMSNVRTKKEKIKTNTKTKITTHFDALLRQKKVPRLENTYLSFPVCIRTNCIYPQLQIHASTYIHHTFSIIVQSIPNIDLNKWTNICVYRVPARHINGTDGRSDGLSCYSLTAERLLIIMINYHVYGLYMSTFIWMPSRACHPASQAPWWLLWAIQSKYGYY